MKPERVILEATSLLDIFPTISEIVSEKSEERKVRDTKPLDGESLMGLLRGEKRKSERSLYHFCDSEIFAVRTQLEDEIYKLIIREPLLTPRGSCEGNILTTRKRFWDLNIKICRGGIPSRMSDVYEKAAEVMS